MNLRSASQSAAALALSLLAACSNPGSHPQDARPSVRLSPTGWKGAPAGALVDRDTATAFSVTAPTSVTLLLDHQVELRRLKVHGAKDVAVEVEGLDTFGEPSAEGWAAAELAEPRAAREVTVRLTPTGPDARLDELEVWGAGRPLAPREPRALEAALGALTTPNFEDLRVLDATPNFVTLQPTGSGEGERCVRLSFPAFDPHQARRAYLAFDADVPRAVALQVSLDGEAPREGFWLGGMARVRPLLEELDPERLRGADVLTVCLPQGAGSAVTLRRPRLVLLLDTGLASFDRESALRLGAAVDGDAATAGALPRGTSAVGLDRALDVERAELRLAHVPAHLDQVATFDGAAWRERGGVELAAESAALPVDGRVAALRLVFAGPAREDAPAASVSEVDVAGSGVGPRVGASRIILTYPSVTLREGREVVERFGDRAFVAGWAESPAGAGEVEVDGVSVGQGGAFSTALRKPAGTQGAWTVRIKARFPDGTEATRELLVDDDRTAELVSDGAAAGVSGGSKDARFGRENQTAYGRIDPLKGGRAALGTDVLFEAPEGAVAQGTSVSITRKGPEVVPPLDAGMLNVTAPAHAGYRFLPHGQKFLKPARVTLPYDPALLPEGVAPEEIQTFFYDEAQEKWVPLPRREVRRGTQQIVSETTHFTFMINAVLVLPEHPGPASFNPTSIKDLKAADPAEGIDLIEPPGPNNQGTARLAFPIRLPRARGAYQPSLALTYDSARGSGWVGVGWDLAVPSVSIDTRYGVPEYTGEERYLLSGEALVPVGSGYEHGTTCADGSQGRPYVARVEREFSKILRCGADPTSYWFEVTDKSGTLQVYGHADTAHLTSYIPRVTNPPRDPAVYDIAQWNLERVIDANGNLTEYGYQLDSIGGDDGVHHENYRQVYLRSIRYSGTADRTDKGALSGGTPGPYVVLLRHEKADRPDVVTSARTGFKTVMRRRLGRIIVQLEHLATPAPDGQEPPATVVEPIRSYLLNYEQGDLGKTRLKAVAVHGADGTLFYKHRFQYETHDLDKDGVTLFGAPVAWLGDVTKDGGLGGSVGSSVGFHGFVGLGLGPSKAAGAVGVGFGFNHSNTTTQTSFVDLNGDGLPDRLTHKGGKQEVLFNHGGQAALLEAPPAWDPAARLASVPASVATGIDEKRIGRESSNSFDVSLQAFGGPLSLNLGASYSQSSSHDFILDANGDGLPDLVNGSEVYFNQPRSAACTSGDTAACCPAGRFCFLQSYPVKTLADLGDSKGTVEDDGALEGGNDAIASALTSQDAVLEWTASYEGVIDIAGALSFAHQGALPAGVHDGVRLRVYRTNGYATEPPVLLLELKKDSGDFTETPVDLRNYVVHSGDLFYFVLSTLRDVPMNTPDGKISPIEKVQFAPVITYQGMSDEKRSWRDPTGAFTYRFDAKEDFSLAGHPQGMATAQRSGQLAFTLNLAKRLTSDGVRLCIQAYGPSEVPAVPPPCQPGDWFYREYAPGDVVSAAEERLPERTVAAGDVFFVRVDTDLAIAPRDFDLSVTGTMRCVEAGGECRVPTASEADQVNFTAQPYFPLHEPVEPFFNGWAPDKQVLRPFVAKKPGTVYVSSRAWNAQRFEPIIFSARTLNRPVLKVRGDHGGVDENGEKRWESGSAHLAVGDQLFLEAHSESAAALSEVCTLDGCSGPSWEVVCRFVAEDGTEEDCSGLARSTTDRHVEGWDGGNRPLLAGGLHGWRYGAWTGRDDEAFQPWVYRAPPKPKDGEWDGDKDEVVERQKNKLKDPANPERIRMRLLGLLVPSAAGTRSPLTGKGLEPGVPAYVSLDGNTYFTAGYVHASRKGQRAEVRDGATSVAVTDVSFGIGEIARTSTAISVSAGASLPVYSASISSGMSQQKLDVLDMNGDGIIDVVASGGVEDLVGKGFSDLLGLGSKLHTDVRVTNPASLEAGHTVYLPGVPQLSIDLSGQVGMGASDPVKMMMSDGEYREVAGRLPNLSGSVGFNVSSTLQQLTDVNGDGLADSVRRGQGTCEGGLLVRLNLGTSFAAQEDCISGTSAGLPTDALLAKFKSKETPKDEDSARSTGIANGVAGMDAVRRATTFTVQGTVGEDLVQFLKDLNIAALKTAIDKTESFGVSVSWSSSFSTTNLALTDVTGDGLPDYVYKGNGPGDFYVRVNTGYGFAPLVKWQPKAPWAAQGAASSLRFQVDADSSVQPLVDAFLGSSQATGGLKPGIDALEATGTHNLIPSVGVAVSFAFPLTLVGIPPYLHVGGGVSGTPQRISGFELGLQDIDGDGFVDQVLKTGHDGAVFARLNQLGKLNLLKHVDRPLGGSMDLAYEQRAGNTVDMPESRWVLTRVTVHDGVRTGTGHDLETTFRYANGRHDRTEREFLGFGEVVRTNADGSTVTVSFKNDGVLTKGLVESEAFRDAKGALWTETVYTYAPPEKVRTEDARCAAATPKFLDSGAYCGSWFVGQSAIEKRHHEGQAAAGIVSRQRFTYDANGNVTHFEDEGDVADTNDNLKADIVYAADSAAVTFYALGRPQTVLVTDGSGTTLRKREAVYDRKGNLLTLRAETGAGKPAVTTLTWKGNGTLETFTGPENYAGKSATLAYEYDGLTGTYVTRTTDHHQYTSTAKYDARFGEATITTDVNGNVITRDFDSFGRMWRLVGPYDTTSAPTVQIDYVPNVVPAYAQTSNRLPRHEGDTRGTVDTVVLKDGLGRVIQTKKSAEVDDGGTGKRLAWSISGHQTFDILGRVVEQGQPFASYELVATYVEGTPVLPTKLAYDVLGRVTSREEPNGATTTTTYGFGKPGGTTLTRFQTTTTDAEKKVKVAYADAAGRIVAMEEHIADRTPTTHYVYDPMGQMTEVADAKGNKTVSAYDLLGRRTDLTNPDSGHVHYTFDPAGNLREKVDSNLRNAHSAIVYAYDVDLLTDITYPTASRNVHYEYGKPGQHELSNGVGRVVEVRDEAGREERTYGKLGEVTSTTRVLRPLLPGDRERRFTSSFVYDSFGRMLSVTYPDGERVEYGYDGGGAVEKVTGYRPATDRAPAETETYLSELTYNALGQRVRMVLGNEVETTYSYEADTLRLHGVVTKTPLGRTLQNLTYTYDLVGNIKKLVNGLGEPVDDRSGEVTYDYDYDDLHRLKWAHGEARARPNTVDRFTATYAYSDIHNMELNSQLHEIVHSDGTEVTTDLPPKTNHHWDYEYDPKAPHRATRIGDTRFVYDDNGNTLRECRDQGDPTCTTSADQLKRFVWTEENRLAQVVQGGGRNTTRFLYDAAGDRVAKLGAGGESITLGQFWALKGRHAATKHIFVGSARLASKVLPPPGWDASPSPVTPTSGVGDGVPNDTGCDPSDYQPQKCPLLPGGDPSVPVEYDGSASVRPETYYYHSDHLGSTSWITDQNGRVHEHVEYFPYGAVWREPRSDSDGASVKGQRFLFTGKELDEETGLYYFGARYVDPARARWLSPDPIFGSYVPTAGSGAELPGMGGVFNPVTLQTYSYGYGNPISLQDVDGNEVLYPISYRWSNSNDAFHKAGDPYLIATYAVYDLDTYMPPSFEGLTPISTFEVAFEARHKDKDPSKDNVLSDEGRWMEMSNLWDRKVPWPTNHQFQVSDIGKSADDSVMTTRDGKQVGFSAVRMHGGGAYFSKACLTSPDPQFVTYTNPQKTKGKANAQAWGEFLKKAVPSLNGTSNDPTFIYLPPVRILKEVPK